MEKNWKQQEKVLEKLVGDRVVSVVLLLSCCHSHFGGVQVKEGMSDMLPRFPQTTCVSTQGTGMHGVWRP